MMIIDDTKKNTKEKMQRTIKTLCIAFSKIRTGRANPEILDYVFINYQGTLKKINTVSNISLINSNTICINPWDKKLLLLIDKSIRESNLGLNSIIQDNKIRVSLIPLTLERRKEIVKFIKNESENIKISIRNVRRDANEILKKLLKNKKCSENEERRAQEEIQKMTNKFIEEVNQLRIKKEKEVLTI